jgi:hypothetical protein
MAQRRIRALASTAGLAAAIVILHRAGAGALAAPPITSPRRLDDWLSARDGATSAMAVLRLVALALCWYVLGATALALVAGTRADALTHPALRRVVHGLAGAGLTASAATLVVGGGDGRAAPTGQTATMQRLPESPDAGAEWMVRLDDPADGGDTATLRLLPEVAAPVPQPPADTWLVTRGDCLWSIAESHLADEWGRAATDAEIDPYWRTLIAANASSLVDPSNPGLLFADQTVVLPPVPPASTR